MRTLILIAVAFTAGYFTHLYITRYNISDAITEVVSDTKTPQVKSSNRNADIVYENGRFKPDSVTVGVSRYLSITNNSDSLMWLTSDYPGLFTVRGYAKSEQVRIRAEKPGTYHIGNKLNLEAKATVKVE